MPLRMAESCLRVRRTLSYYYRIVDIRDLDNERLLASPHVGENIFAILTSPPERGATVRRIVKRIAGLGPGQREAVLRLSILAGLRNLGQVSARPRNRPRLRCCDPQMEGGLARFQRGRRSACPACIRALFIALGRPVLHAKSLEELLQ